MFWELPVIVVRSAKDSLVAVEQPPRIEIDSSPLRERLYFFEPPSKDPLRAGTRPKPFDTFPIALPAKTTMGAFSKALTRMVPPKWRYILETDRNVRNAEFPFRLCRKPTRDDKENGDEIPEWICADPLTIDPSHAIAIVSKISLWLAEG